MPARFVILHHVLPAGEHWDLMLEHDGVLLTWQLPVQPPGPIPLPSQARRIKDHRIAYLDYEGPISDDRGAVTRVDRGDLSIIDLPADRVDFEASGRRLCGRFVLQHVVNNEWELALVSTPAG